MTPVDAVPTPERWWVVWPGGRKLGPFESLGLALKVQSYVEAAEGRIDLDVRQEGEL